MSKKFGITKEFECEICCTLTPARKGDPQTMEGPGSPDEPATVEDLYVAVIIRNASIDITRLLNDRQREHFELLCLEEFEEVGA